MAEQQSWPTRRCQGKHCRAIQLLATEHRDFGMCTECLRHEAPEAYAEELRLAFAAMGPINLTSGY